MTPALAKEVALRFDTDREGCSVLVRRFAAQLGFDRTEAARIATAAAELVSNALKFSGSGVLKMVALTSPPGLQVEVRDQGPGIADREAALDDGYSEGAHTDPARFSSARRGLGCGLGAAKRLMDEIEIESAPGQGTRVVVRKYLSARA